MLNMFIVVYTFFKPFNSNILSNLQFLGYGKTSKFFDHRFVISRAVKINKKYSCRDVHRFVDQSPVRMYVVVVVN